jgi:hypothetical protein
MISEVWREGAIAAEANAAEIKRSPEQMAISDPYFFQIDGRSLRVSERSWISS